MELLEYQTKDLFQQANIPVPSSIRIDNPGSLKNLSIQYPLLLKPQLHSRRLVAPEIRTVTNTIDAIAIAQSLFGLAINGERPAVLLAETPFTAHRHLYLAIEIDARARGPVLIGRAEDYLGLERKSAQLQVQPVGDRFSPHYARRLAVAMGLEGALLQHVSSIVERMYGLFAGFDLDRIEISPLGVGLEGEIMALDGRVSANAAAIGRHPQLLALRSQDDPQPSRRDAAQQNGMNLLQLSSPSEGLRVGVLANGYGLLLAAIDTLTLLKAPPNIAIDVCGRVDSEAIIWAIELLSSYAPLDYIVIDCFGTLASCVDISRSVLHCYTRHYHRLGEQAPHFVLRLHGRDLEAAQQTLAKHGIAIHADLKTAITHEMQQVDANDPNASAPTENVTPITVENTES